MGTNNIPPLVPIHHGFRLPSQGQRVISTKVDRRKMPSICIDEISFHSEECVFHWKYVMKQRITDKSIVSDQLHSCVAVIELIANVGMMCTVNNIGIFYPKLVHEFIVNLPINFNEPETPDFWKVHRDKCIPVSPLLLNQFLNVPLLLAQLTVIRLLSNLFWNCLRDRNCKLVPIYIFCHHFHYSCTACILDWHGLITNFLLSHHLDLLADDDVAGPAPRTISLSYKTFQGAHVSDLPATFRPPYRGVGSSGAELPVLDDGLHLLRDLALRVMQLLSDESQIGLAASQDSVNP
ncbi:flocculation protein FLO11-like [Cucumis melo var. makuwa]|uniref:Flocculation protein FLO11-like n=1 Tax=Cucumis melo var. makuwa TaxID=1194695 RepID=A0A5D3D5S2_CUCMM|nr:flocculation protein FLO11-like [Cucumis melo var. makuwa]